MTVFDGIAARIVETPRLAVNILERTADDPATPAEQTSGPSDIGRRGPVRLAITAAREENSSIMTVTGIVARPAPSGL